MINLLKGRVQKRGCKREGGGVKEYSIVAEFRNIGGHEPKDQVAYLK